MLLQRLLSDDPIAVEIMNDPSCIQSVQQDQQEERNEIEDRVHQLASALKVAVCELRRWKQREKADKEYNARLRKLMDKVVEESNERQKTYLAMQMEFMEEKKKIISELEKTQHQLKSTESEKATLSQDNELLRKHILELTSALSKTRSSNAVSVESTTHLNTQAAIRSTATPLPCVAGATQLTAHSQWQGQTSAASSTINAQSVPITSFATVVNPAPFTLIINSAASARPASPDVTIISPPPAQHPPAAAMFPVQLGSLNPAQAAPEEALEPVSLTQAAPSDYIAPCWEPGGDTAVWWPPMNVEDDSVSVPPYSGQVDSGVPRSITNDIPVIDLVDCCSDVNEDENNGQQKSVGNSESSACSSVRNHEGEVPSKNRFEIANYLSCGKCGVIVSRAHYSRHSCPSIYKCQECKKPFVDFSKLARHQRTHTGHRQCTCDSCGKSFSCMNDLNQHVQTHLKDRRHVCKKCGKAYTRSSHLVRHIKAAHGPAQQKLSIVHFTPSNR